MISLHSVKSEPNFAPIESPISERPPPYRRGRKAHLPAEGTFGNIFRIILGGPEANYDDASKHLGLPASVISRIARNLYPLSQQSLKKMRLRENLVKFYGARFKVFGKAFDAIVADLPEYPSKRGIKASGASKKERAGYILWLILGAEKANLKKASERLGISEMRLCGYTNKGRRIPKRFLEYDQWPKILADFYGDIWFASSDSGLTYGDEFMKRAKRELQLPKRMRHVKNKWRNAKFLAYRQRRREPISNRGLWLKCKSDLIKFRCTIEKKTPSPTVEPATRKTVGNAGSIWYCEDGDFSTDIDDFVGSPERHTKKLEDRPKLGAPSA